jgi:hypothetical protein
MSFDHWWFGVLLDPQDYERIAPGFAAALAEAVLSPEATHALEAWRTRPADYSGVALSGREAEAVNAFIWAFNLPGFEDFAEEVFVDDELRGDLLDEHRLFRFAMIPRNTPVSIVWHALGHERASTLPGRMGNLLLRADEVAGARAAVRDAYRGTSERALIDAAKAYCGADVFDDGVLRDVIGFLPDGLARAQAAGKGFLSLSRAQI